MIQIRKYTPDMAWSGERIAKRYARRLVGPGSAGAFILLFPVSQPLGLLLGVAMMAIARYEGKEFRGIQPELARPASLARQLFLIAAAAKFLVVITIFWGIGLGVTDWQGALETRAAVLQWFQSMPPF